MREPRGAALSPVLNDLIVQRRQGEWDLSCAGETIVTDRILRMIPGRNGQDISVLERITHGSSKETQGDGCSSNKREC